MWEPISSFNVITIAGSKNIDGFLENIKTVQLQDKMKVHTFEGVGSVNNGAGVCSNVSACLDIFRPKHRCCNDICQDIAKNHKSIIEQAYTAGEPNVAIFEDDARFVQVDGKTLQRMLHFLQTADWDIFYFGHFPVIPVGYPVARDVVRTFYPGLFHAYVVNRRAMPAILRIDNANYIDLIVGRDQSLKKYAAYPGINYQLTGPGMYSTLPIAKVLNFNTLNAIFERIQYYGLVVFLLVVLLALTRAKQ